MICVGSFMLCNWFYDCGSHGDHCHFWVFYQYFNWTWFVDYVWCVIYNWVYDLWIIYYVSSMIDFMICGSHGDHRHFWVFISIFMHSTSKLNRVQRVHFTSSWGWELDGLKPLDYAISHQTTVSRHIFW